MTFEEFRTYAERLYDLGVRGFILTGGGEPTLCPDFDKITGWLEDQGLDYGINTNFNILKFFRPNYLKVSLDGYDEDSYEKSRGVRKYSTVIENIKRYSEWRRTNSPKTSLGIQLVATSAEEVQRFYLANKSLDVDYIAFRPIESTGGSYYQSGAKKSEARTITAYIRALSKVDDRVTLNFKWDMLSMREKTCSANWAQIALNERGEVMYCCHKPYQIVGHILDDDILAKKEAAGTNMARCDIPCRMTAPNRFVQSIAEPRTDANFI